jgi:hypothetical protein
MTPSSPSWGLPPLNTRSNPAISLQERGITTRLLAIRAASADDETRSVEVVMATDAPVTVWDWERGLIDEVLVAGGGIFSDKMPLLANHSRWSLDDVLGSARGARREGGRWLGRAYFAEGDEDAEKAWNKVRQGHLTDVSIGYRALEYEDIPPGTTRRVKGRSYTAGERTLRISTSWQAMELSVVPIGADQQAKVRAGGVPQRRRNTSGRTNSGERITMPKALRKYLESIGLRRDASVKEAKRFLKGLKGAQRAKAEKIMARADGGDAAVARAARSAGLRVNQRADDMPVDDEEDVAEEEDDDPEREDVEEDDDMEREDDADEDKEGNRSARRPRGQRSQDIPHRAESFRRQGARAERERVSSIRELAADHKVGDDLLGRAIDEGWTYERACEEFLESYRSRRSPSAGADGVTAGGTSLQVGTDAARAHRAAAMSIALLGHARTNQGPIDLARYAERNLIAANDLTALRQAAMQFGQARRMIDVFRMACELDNIRTDYNDERTIRAAVSGGSLSGIFTTSINAVLLQAWEEEGDTTDGWVSEEDVPDFKPNPVIDFLSKSQLKKLPRGGTAEDATAEDSELSYKIARYAKKFSIDEQDVIDDRWGALFDMPVAMGTAARRLRPDLIYSILLTNGTLLGGTLFNSTALNVAGGHANLMSGGDSALAAASLKSAIQMMGKQYILDGKLKKVLNIRPEFLIVPQALRFTAAELLQSTAIVIAGTAGGVTERGTKNTLEGIVQLRVDERIGATGVQDPDTEQVRTGTDTNWFLAARGGRTIKVAYRRGTGRAPQIRSYVLDKGQWGIGWDVNHDIGAKAVDFRGMAKSAGA